MKTQTQAHRLNAISARKKAIAAKRAALLTEDMALAEEACRLFKFDDERSDESLDLFEALIAGKGPAFEAPKAAKLPKLSKADTKYLATLVTHYNMMVNAERTHQLDDFGSSLAHFFSSPVGGWLRSSSGDIVRAKRDAAILATFPNMSDVALSKCARAKLTGQMIVHLNWPLI